MFGEIAQGTVWEVVLEIRLSNVKLCQHSTKHMEHNVKTCSQVGK